MGRRYVFWGWTSICQPGAFVATLRAIRCARSYVVVGVAQFSLRQVCRWLVLIECALETLHLAPGMASKLAGKLSWGCSQLFCRIGRAMLRPLYDQRTRRDGKVDRELERALRWWLMVLKRHLAERRDWHVVQEEVLHMFCDARGSPPTLAAVLFVQDECLYTHMVPPAHVMEQFRSRKDQQIMGLELLAISLGLCTFQSTLEGRRVVVHCDNTGSEVAIRRGTARSWDHAQLVHEQWLHAACKQISIFVRRVCTDDNIADLPSRGELELLAAVGAVEVEPMLAATYMLDATWDVLQERWAL